MGDISISISAGGIGMEDITYREVKKKRKKNEGKKKTGRQLKRKTSKVEPSGKPIFFKGQRKMSLQKRLRWKAR